MTFRETVSKLKSAGIENARSEALILFEYFLGIEPSRIPLIYDEDFISNQLFEAVEKRVTRFPLQYILGEWEFFGLKFKVNPNCLCPRADTEILVERAISILPNNAKFIELCTGSGCISVSILKNRLDLRGIATDKFEKTLQMARINARENGVLPELELEVFRGFGETNWGLSR